SATTLFEKMGSMNVGDWIYPRYNLLVIAVGGLAALFLWAFIYRTNFGILLRATSQDMRRASALGVNVNLVFVEAFTIGCFMAGLGGAIVVPSQSAVLGMGVDALILSFIVVVIGGLGSLEGALAGSLIVGILREVGISVFPEIELAVLYLIAAIVLLVRPAGLFGLAAYAVAFMVKYLHVQSMELFVLAAILSSFVVSALFGFVCVRYTRIFFSILTLALSQVLWSLAFKFYGVTGGTDGLRVPTP